MSAGICLAPFFSLYLTMTLLTVAFLFIMQFPDFSAPGRFGHAYRTVDIPGSTETMVGSRIYYPDSAGVFPNSARPAPIVVFGHGWQMGIDRYYSYARHLASWGYVVCLPTISNPLINPQHDRRARLMVDAARFVAALDTVVGDPFYRCLDRTSWGFAGHSMGGGLAMLAADLFGLQDTLKVAVAICSPQTSPATRSANLQLPKLVLAGGVDNIAPWRDVRQAYWDSAPPPGTFAVISGANHGYVMDYSYFWENGGTARITRAEQQQIIRRHLTAFLERYLHQDTSTWNYHYCFGDSIFGHPTMDSVEVRFIPTGVKEQQPAEEGMVPCKWFGYGHAGMTAVGRTALYDVRGGRVREFPHQVADVSGLAPGVYFLRQEGKPVRRLVIAR